MPKMTYGESTTLLDVPAGWYVARFMGTEAREPIKESRFGNEGAPRMGWLWEVTEGPHRGKKISQESGVRASLKSTAMRMLTGLSGGKVAVGQQVDTDTFVGRLYRVKVAVNDASDKGNLHVADVEPYEAAAPAPAPAGNGRPAAGPPPRRQAAAPAAPPETSYWVCQSDTGDPVSMSFREMEDWVRAEHRDPAEVQVCKGGEVEYKSAAHYGVTLKSPSGRDDSDIPF
jgi:hypothetical protein